MKAILTLLLLTVNIFYGIGQADSMSITGRVFQLGEVSIIENKPAQALSIVRRDEIIKFNFQNIAEALNVVPGVTVTTTGARNESTVFLRGYDTRQIALLVDGIPVYIPFDGNLDFGRYPSWNYEKIVISKGFSSMLYGPNTMGGVINLITSVPEKKWELNAATSVEFGNRAYNGNDQEFRIGSQRKKFFYQATFLRNDLKGWDLSENFEKVDLQERGRRLNSSEKDIGFSIRLGYVPDNDQSYVISYSHQDGAKDIPVYDGPFRKRFWRMPEWDKRSLYFNSKFSPFNDFELVSRLFYDKFQNTLESYDDNSFTSQERNYAFTSHYDDYSLGASLDLKNRSIRNNEISLALLVKYDNHIESTDNETDPLTAISDNIFTLAAEDEFRINDNISLTGGISWNVRNNITAKEYYPDNLSDVLYFPSGRDQALNYRFGIYLTVKENQNFWLNTSLSSRFATMKERYSYRLGQVIPNPELGSEMANHFNSGYSLYSEKFSMSGEIFYSLGRDRITYVNINPDTIQYQNIEKTQSMGLEAELRYKLLKAFEFKVNYGYLRIENLRDPDFYFINIPNHNLRFSAEYRFARRFVIIADYNYLSQRYSYSDGSYPVEAYGTTNLNFNAELTDGLLIRLSANNLFDVNYYYSEGYPARGRFFRFGMLLSMGS